MSLEARQQFFDALKDPTNADMRHRIWVGRGEDLACQLGVADLLETPYELLPESDFWVLLEGYAEDQSISLVDAFAYYLNQAPSLVTGHPFLRPRAT